MSNIDRRLEDLFAADARARRVGRVAIQGPGRPWLAFALAGAAAVALGLTLALAFVPDGDGVAGPDPAATATATPAATATPCIDVTEEDVAIGGAKIGRHTGASIDRLTVDHAAAQWYVRFFVGPGATGDPDPLTIPLEVTLTGPDGDHPVLGYAAGPPEGPFTPATQRVTVQPCRPVVLRITTAAVTPGEYTLTFPDLGLPEGGELTVPMQARVSVCEPVPGGETECRNTAGTRATPPPPTTRPAPTLSPRPGYAVIAGEVGYPAGFRPELEVYAIDTSDPSRWFSVTQTGWIGPGTGATATPQPDPGKRYAIEVPPGTYYVLAYSNEGPGETAGLYSEAVPCGLRASCTDHSLIEVTVVAGETRDGVDPTDWYYPEGTSYPPRPE